MSDEAARYIPQDFWLKGENAMPKWLVDLKMRFVQTKSDTRYDIYVAIMLKMNS